MHRLVAAHEPHAAQFAPQHHAVLTSLGQPAFEMGKEGIKDARRGSIEQADGEVLDMSELAHGPACQTHGARNRHQRFASQVPTQDFFLAGLPARVALCLCGPLEPGAANRMLAACWDRHGAGAGRQQAPEPDADMLLHRPYRALAHLG